MKTTEYILYKSRMKNNCTNRSVELKSMRQECSLQNRHWQLSVIDVLQVYFLSFYFVVFFLSLCIYFHLCYVMPVSPISLCPCAALLTLRS
jgi:hypothetical protein